MRTLLGFITVLGVIACGRSESTEVGPQAALPEPQSAPIEVASAPKPVAIPSAATGLELGIVYAGNMMGELEPCG